MDLHRRDFLVKIPAVGALAAVSSNGAFVDFLKGLYKNSSRGWATFQHPLAQPKVWSLVNNQTFHGSTMGIVATVKKALDQSMVAKCYDINGTCIGGASPLPTYRTEAAMKLFYETEKEAYSRLRSIGSRFIPKQVRFDDETRTVYTSFEGDDLSLCLEKGVVLPENWESQVIAMVEEYQKVGLFKSNISFSNLVYNPENESIKAIGFSVAKPRQGWAFKTEVERIFQAFSHHSVDYAEQLVRANTDFSMPEAIKVVEMWKHNWKTPEDIPQTYRGGFQAEEADRYHKLQATNSGFNNFNLSEFIDTQSINLSIKTS